MNNRHLFGLAAALVLAGGLLFLYKALWLGFPLTATATAERWDVEARIRFRGDGGPVKAALSVPSTGGRFAIVDENFISRGFGLSTRRRDGDRQVVWAKAEVRGDQALYYRAAVQEARAEFPALPSKPPQVPAHGLDEQGVAAAQALLDEARSHSADLDTLVSQLIQVLTAPDRGTGATLLLQGQQGALARIQVVRQILAIGAVPARSVQGIQLKETRKGANLLPWLEVYDGERWRGYDPSSGEPGFPEDLLVIVRGDQAPLQIEGARQGTADWAVRLNQEAALGAAVERGKLFSRQLVDFSLFGLPIETQQVYRVLLMIPIGAFLLVLLRNVVGIKTFGTFMPVLIALAFRETQLLGGIVMFTMLVGLGLAVRFYLEHLKLLLVPRLASLLIIVVVLMALVSVFSHRLGLERGLSVALFPMVIITMTIERMSIVWDERGAREAIQQGLGSLLVAAIAYLVMFNRVVEHLVFVFPELLLILLALTLLLGRYSGYRLLELRRFKALAEIGK